MEVLLELYLMQVVLGSSVEEMHLKKLSKANIDRVKSYWQTF